MAEPVPGITADADDNNARYFHVKVAGPKDVRPIYCLPTGGFLCSIIYSIILMFFHGQKKCFR